MPEPFPKLMVNRQGERLFVADFFEQDAATSRGYYRSLGRIAERHDAEAAGRNGHGELPDDDPPTRTGESE